MRISDWSSDVCSSDLDGRPDQSLCDFGTSQANTEIIAFGDYCRSLFHHQLHWAILAAKRLDVPRNAYGDRSEEHTSELQLLMRIAYAVFCLNKKPKTTSAKTTEETTK